MTDGSHKLITCILPKGAAMPAVRLLKDQAQLPAANVHTARGVGRFTHPRERRLGDVSEKEVLRVLVENARADEIFEFLYYQAQIDKPHGGFIFMTPVTRATPFELPSVPDEAQ